MKPKYSQPDPKGIENINKWINLLVNASQIGNYSVKFTLVDEATNSGIVDFTHAAGNTFTGRFHVYLDDHDVYIALYSANKEKVLDRPAEEFLNILKITLLAKP